MNFLTDRKSAEPLVSVVIPAYNERERVYAALESVMGSDYERHQTIVVANACTDDTAKVARELADVVIETPNQGISLAKNLGVTASQGRIISFLDADSRMLPDLMTRTVESVGEGYAGGKARYWPSDDDSWQARAYAKFSELNSRFWLPFRFTDGGSGAYTFVDRAVWDRIVDEDGEGFNTEKKVMEDVDFAVRIKKRGKVQFITDTGILTSMRRFQEEGYARLLLKDAVDVLLPKKAHRSRWNNN